MKTLSAELAELEGLVARGREAGKKHAHAAPNPAAPDVTPSLAPEALDELVASLRAALEQPVEDLEEAIASHPLGSVAAAFFLGVLVGRLLPRG